MYAIKNSRIFATLFQKVSNNADVVRGEKCTIRCRTCETPAKSLQKCRIHAMLVNYWQTMQTQLSACLISRPRN